MVFGDLLGLFRRGAPATRVSSPSVAAFTGLVVITALAWALKVAQPEVERTLHAEDVTQSESLPEVLDRLEHAHTSYLGLRDLLDEAKRRSAEADRRLECERAGLDACGSSMRGEAERVAELEAAAEDARARVANLDLEEESRDLEVDRDQQIDLATRLAGEPPLLLRETLSPGRQFLSLLAALAAWPPVPLALGVLGGRRRGLPDVRARHATR